MLKNIVTPIEPLTQSIKALFFVGLLLPVFILSKISFRASTNLVPCAYSNLARFSFVNIKSTFSCHCTKYFFLFTFDKLFCTSLSIVVSAQFSVGIKYPFGCLDNNLTFCAKAFKVSFFLTIVDSLKTSFGVKPVTSFKSLLSSSGLKAYMLFHK